MNESELGTSNDLKADINVTPLVDVMLVMLIIFMIVTPLLQKGIGVVLPMAENVHPVSENATEVLLLTLMSNGQVYLGSQPIDRGGLGKALRTAYVSNPSRQFQIKADRNLAFGEIKQIVRYAREAGFPGAALVAEKIKDQEAPPSGEK